MMSFSKVQLLATSKYITVLTWAREHDLVLNERACGYAALHDNLPMLQWLRENECPWDVRVIHLAELQEHVRVVVFEGIVKWLPPTNVKIQILLRRFKSKRDSSVILVQSSPVH
jgi:response regulator of citrate/malate metabolism